MADYLLPQLEPDEDAIHELFVARLKELLPGWQDRDTAIESLLSRAKAAGDAVLVDLMVDVLATITAEIGRTVDVVRDEPAPASVELSITSDGLAVYELPAGSSFVATLPDQSELVVQTVDQVVFEQSGTSDPVEVTGIVAEAVDVGKVDAISLGPVEPDQSFNWLASATLTSVVSYGHDGLTDDEFLDKVSRQLRLYGRVLVHAEDFAAFAQEQPGVGRALGINLLDATDPEAPEDDVERCVTVVITAENGMPPSPTLISEVKAALEARRETSFKLFVVEPTYIPVEIELTVAAWPDAMDSAEGAVEAALLSWLHPGTFGNGGPRGSDVWERTATIRVGEVVSVADSVTSAVAYVDPTLVMIGLDGDPPANADAVLDAPIVALPDPENTTITVNVVEREP